MGLTATKTHPRLIDQSTAVCRDYPGGTVGRTLAGRIRSTDRDGDRNPQGEDISRTMARVVITASSAAGRTPASVAKRSIPLT